MRIFSYGLLCYAMFGNAFAANFNCVVFTQLKGESGNIIGDFKIDTNNSESLGVVEAIEGKLYGFCGVDEADERLGSKLNEKSLVCGLLLAKSGKARALPTKATRKAEFDELGFNLSSENTAYTYTGTNYDGKIYIIACDAAK